MSVTIKMIRELNKMTDKGMMSCKKALVETGGNIDGAIEFLRKEGHTERLIRKRAVKGAVAILVADNKRAVIIEVNSETEQVAKSTLFQEYIADVATQLINSKAVSKEDFMAESWAKDTSKTVAEELISKSAVIGEHLNIRRYETISTDGYLVGFSYLNGEIGILVNADIEVINDTVKETLRNIAMQIAALAPKYVCRDEISQEFIAHQTEILRVQIMKENPEQSADVIESIVKEHLNKKLKECCLLDQTYVKDSDLTVAKYLEAVSKAVGSRVVIKNFVRFEVDETITEEEPQSY